MASKKPAPKKSGREGKLYVMRTIPIDRFTSRRELVEILPSTCDVCGYDVCRSNKLPSYDKMDELEQAKVKEVLKKHKEKHSTAEGPKIIKGEDVPTRWSKKPRFS